MKRVMILAILVLGTAGAWAARATSAPLAGQETADKEPRRKGYHGTAVAAVRG